MGSIGDKFKIKARSITNGGGHYNKPDHSGDQNAANMASKSNSIGDGGSVNSKSLLEADGKFDGTRAQPNKGAGSIIGPYSHVPVSNKDPRVNSKEPPRKAGWGKVGQPK
jgi:hypothetical protein